MAAVNRTWVGTTSGDYSVSTNWSPAAVPLVTDNVRIPAGSPAITAGLNQSAVSLGDFIVEDGFANTIASSAAYLQIVCSRFLFYGTGLSYIDIGTSAIAPQVFKTAAAAQGYRGLYLKGSAITTLSVMGGKVGLASLAFETATATTVRVTGSGSVWIGAAATLTTLLQERGDSVLRSAATTVRVHGGT